MPLINGAKITLLETNIMFSDCHSFEPNKDLVNFKKMLV